MCRVLQCRRRASGSYGIPLKEKFAERVFTERREPIGYCPMLSVWTKQQGRSLGHAERGQAHLRYTGTYFPLLSPHTGRKLSHITVPKFCFLMLASSCIDGLVSSARFPHIMCDGLKTSSETLNFGYFCGPEFPNSGPVMHYFGLRENLNLHAPLAVSSLHGNMDLHEKEEWRLESLLVQTMKPLFLRSSSTLSDMHSDNITAGEPISPHNDTTTSTHVSSYTGFVPASSTRCASGWSGDHI